MSAVFASASSAKLLNTSAQVTAAPFTVGAWVYPTSLATQVFWSLCDTGTTNNYWTLGLTATVWRLACDAAITATNCDVGTSTANSWVFFLARCISGANRRLSVLQADGSIAANQNTTVRTPAGIDAVALGCRNASTPTAFFDGMVAEWWWTDTDIQAATITTATEESLVRQLAYYGPFSVPRIAEDIIEYHSLVDDIDSRSYDLFDDYWRGATPTWANTAATLGPAPPLPYYYIRPGQRRKILAV